jgi:hypothetical protein
VCPFPEVRSNSEIRVKKISRAGRAPGQSHLLLALKTMGKSMILASFVAAKRSRISRITTFCRLDTRSGEDSPRFAGFQMRLPLGGHRLRKSKTNSETSGQEKDGHGSECSHLYKDQASQSKGTTKAPLSHYLSELALLFQRAPPRVA